MRLLEFNRDEGGANPIMANPGTPAEATQPTVKLPDTAPSPSKTPTPTPISARQARQARVFPLKSKTIPRARRKPIDLEQLQQRVEVLERRIKARTEALGDEVVARDLEKLQQRMKLLERNINSELWAAKQREHTMLQLLAKPTLKTALKQGYTKCKSTTIPAIVKSLGESYRHWWQNSQPGWWTSFAAAWQESLDRARGQTRY